MIGFYHIKDGVSVYYNQLAKLDFQIRKTESAIAHESQSKKRFEYNSRLKEYKLSKDILLTKRSTGCRI